MNVYLAKFVLDGKVAYKPGFTKWFNVEKRFIDEQYNRFDDITILDSIYIEHQDGKIARERCLVVEGFLKCFFKKNFRLESYFNKPDNYFNGLSGITEMFTLSHGMTEQQLLEIFNNVKKYTKELYG
jgi:hypothetical protein